MSCIVLQSTVSLKLAYKPLPGHGEGKIEAASAGTVETIGTDNTEGTEIKSYW